MEQLYLVGYLQILFKHRKKVGDTHSAQLKFHSTDLVGYSISKVPGTELPSSVFPYSYMSRPVSW